MMMSAPRRLSTLAFLAVAMFGAGRTVEANAVPVGPTIQLVIATLTEGNSVAYDPTNHVYLVVGSNGSILGGFVFGRFTDPSGNPLGNPFAVPLTAQHYMFNPTVRFSPDANGGAGGFLVVWHESDLPGSNNSLHARMVAWGQGGTYGPETVVNTDGTYQATRIGMAYSTASKEFLVALARVHGAGGYGIRAVRVDNNANAIAPSFSIAVNNQYEDWPSVGYDPVTNQFLVSYSAYSGSAFVATRLVQAGTNNLIGAGPTVLISTVGTWITDTVYNPRTNQFLVVWVGGGSTSTTYGRLVNPDASIGGPINLISNRFGAVDGMAVDYNPITDTYFLVSGTPISGSDGGIELVGSTGIPVNNGFLTTAQAGRSGDPYPNIAASPEAPNWLITFSASFLGLDAQLVTGTPSGTAPPPGAPPPPVSRPLVDVDLPSKNAVVSTNGFVVTGWAVDAGATSGTGVDVVAVWAFPSNGAAAILAGIANYGGARPDVAAALGNPNFTMTGYGLTTVLAAGSYTLAVYAHSTVNNSWNTPTILNVTVQPPPSKPMMWVDTPAPNATLQASGVITVAGWAVDFAAASGSGVDAVHVWAYPSTGAAPTFVGWSPSGGARPDVGAAFGSSQWSTSGFNVTVTNPLTPGNYTLVAFAHSSVTGTFNDVKTVSITVQ